MSRRYLFGPVTNTFADQCLKRQRDEGHCVTFDSDGKTDLTIRAGDTWSKITTRCPSGWKPDFVVLNVPYNFIPDSLWTAPVPVVGIATDWPLMWHYYRRRLRGCDLVLTDPVGVEVMQREGISQVRAAALYGCECDFHPATVDESSNGKPRKEERRDIDILFVGNLNQAVQRERLQWMMRLARLGKRWRVVVRQGIFGEGYRQLMRRAKIVFSYVQYPRCSRRHTEATAAGALLFEHVQRQPQLPFFRDRQECVFYDSDNLEALLEHYLENDQERQKIAAAGQAKAKELTFERLWDETVGQIEQAWPSLADRPRHRAALSKIDGLTTRVWQAFYGAVRADTALVTDLDAAIAADPKSAQLHNALGLALGVHYRQPTYKAARATVAVEHFERAVGINPDHLAARLNLADALHACGNDKAAIEHCRQGLLLIERPVEIDPDWLDCGQYHVQFDNFQHLWEMAAWSNAGNSTGEVAAKKELLRWRFHLLLFKLTQDLVHQFKAYLIRPELPIAAGGLGIALASKQYHVEAVEHLRRAHEENPLDCDVARALGHMFEKVGDREALNRLIEDRRLVSQAAPIRVPPEEWFSERKPTGKELASIIVLCCNQLEFTKQCLESVVKHTRAPYELIVIDNASTDGTGEYLKEFRSRSGPLRVDVIRNETNVGFPAGCNQGLARSRGRYLVLLNNDTIVTSEWLDRLIARNLTDWPTVGFVGPVTNYAPDAQHVKPSYAEVSGLDEFAARRRKDYTGKWLSVGRLTGFCLLTRREVLDRIGMFDERYGPGFFDDDDLCFRAREAGLKLLIAPDVYIHHFGSQTFKGLGLDTRDQLLRNFEIFQEKWGKEATAEYRIPAAPAPTVLAAEVKQEEAETAPAVTESADDSASEADAPVETPVPAASSTSVPKPSTNGVAPVWDVPANRPTISLCMIVKNEEARLGACLDSAADLFGQVVVVDTGSTDKTKEVAQRYDVTLAEFPWCDSFAAARNESIRHATGRWIMWLDADDRIDKENHRKLEQLFDNLGNDIGAYAMQVRSVMDSAGTQFRLLDQIRIFPNHPDVRWQYRVHEQTLPSVNRLGGRVRWTDIIVDHVGYQDVSARRGKLERNLRLLELDNVDKPDDSFTLFNLGWTLLDLGRLQEALGHLERSLEVSTSDASIVRKLYHLIAVTQRHLGHKEAAQETRHKGLERFPDDTELLLEEATALLDAKDFAKAETNLLQLVENRPGKYFGSADDGVRSFRTRHVLGSNYLERNRLSEAEVQWLMANQERPRFLPAWLALGDLYLKQQRWKAIDQLAVGIERDAGAALEGAILRARGHFVRG